MTYPSPRDEGADATTVDDATLVRDVIAGSHEALAMLYDRYADTVFAASVRLTSDRAVAEEIVQETFLVLWDRAETFDPTVGSMAAWLRTIARNRTVDRLRAAGRRPTTLPMASVLGEGPAGASGSQADALDRVLAGGDLVAASVPAQSPEAMASLGELRTALQAALAVMPEPERTVIVLAYGHDLTQAQIAERLGWPLGTVKTRTRRALRQLREVMLDDIGPEFARYLAPAPSAGHDG